MFFDSQATSTSSSDLFTDLHCVGEDDATFFGMPCAEGNPITMGAVKRTCTHTYTHPPTHPPTPTHTHIHTCTQARTHFFGNDETGWVLLLTFQFLSLFSFFFHYAYEYLLCHLPIISSFHHVAHRHKRTMAQAHTHARNKHVRTCFLALSLVSRSVWNHLSTPLLTFIALVWYTISWGSIHSYSVFLWVLCSLSLSLVSRSVKLANQGIAGVLQHSGIYA